METSLENTKKLFIEENVYLWLKAIAKEKGLTANEYANQLLEAAEAAHYKPTTLSEDLKNPKMKWFVPKNSFALATMLSDAHFKRLRRWLDKKKPLQLYTGNKNELIIENRQIIDKHNARKALTEDKQDATDKSDLGNFRIPMYLVNAMRKAAKERGQSLVEYVDDLGTVFMLCDTSVFKDSK